MVPPINDAVIAPQGITADKSTFLSRLVISILKVAGCLPPDLRSRLGRSVGRLVGLVPSRQVEIAASQLKRFIGPNHPPLGSVYASVAQTALEMINLDPYLENCDRYIEFEEAPLLRSLMARKKGLVALTAHIGNWELLGAYFVKVEGLPLHTAARRARNTTLQPGLRWIRERYGIRTAWRDDRRAVKSIIETLRASGVIAAVVDQDTDVDSELIPFFGIPAKTPTAMVKLALRLDVPLVATFAVRTGLNKYKIHFAEITDRQTYTSALCQFNEHLEKLVREHPDQWAWFHKRWRSTKHGTRMSTGEYLKWLARA